MANKKVSQLTSKPSVLTTDLFPIADPSTGQLFKTTISDLGTAIGSGVSSVNSLVGAVVLDTDDIQELVSPTNKWFTDTRARAALSASSPLTYNSGTGAFGIQVANGSQNGYLSSADWTTFNAKQAALSGTGFVKSTGGTISYDTNTYLTTSAAASTYLPLTGGTLTGNLLGTNIIISNSLIAKGGTFNGGASSSGIITMDGLGSDLLMNRANTSNGAGITLLTNANEMWSLGMRSVSNDNFYIYNSGLLANAVTINSSNSAVTLTGALSGTSATFSGDASFGSGNSDVTITIPTNNTGSGYAGRILGKNSTGQLIIQHRDNSATFVNAITISSGGGSPVLTFGGAATFSSSVTAGTQFIGNNSITDPTAGITTATVYALNGASSNNTFGLGIGAVRNGSYDMWFQTGAINGGGYRWYIGTSEKMTMTNSGNVGIGTTSPSYLLHVKGSGAYNGAIFADNTGTTAGGSFQIGVNGTAVGSISVAGTYLGSTDQNLAYYAGSGLGHIWYSNAGSERMRITSSGHIQTNGNPVYAYSGSISIGGTYQTIFAAVSGGVYLVSVTTDSADGTFGLLTVVNDPDKSLGMIYGNNISLQFSGDNVQMKSTNGSTYNTTWTATRLK